MPPRLELSEIKDSIVFHAAAFFLAASLATAAAARPKNNHATCSIAISLLTFIEQAQGLADASGRAKDCDLARRGRARRRSGGGRGREAPGGELRELREQRHIFWVWGFLGFEEGKGEEWGDG